MFTEKEKLLSFCVTHCRSTFVSSILCPHSAVCMLALRTFATRFNQSRTKIKKKDSTSTLCCVITRKNTLHCVIFTCAYNLRSILIFEEEYCFGLKAYQTKQNAPDDDSMQNQKNTLYLLKGRRSIPYLRQALVVGSLRLPLSYKHGTDERVGGEGGRIFLSTAFSFDT